VVLQLSVSNNFRIIIIIISSSSSSSSSSVGPTIQTVVLVVS